jgi:hypothetical protein
MKMRENRQLMNDQLLKVLFHFFHQVIEYHSVELMERISIKLYHMKIDLHVLKMEIMIAIVYIIY